jgi:hypothetical protein
MNFINKKQKTYFFDITNIYISLFCFYITQFAEYVFNGFLIGTLLFYIYNVFYFLWEKMASYKTITEIDQPIIFVRQISETFLILKIFNYINNLHVANLIKKQIYLYTITIYQIKNILNTFTYSNLKQLNLLLQNITQFINYKDILLSDLYKKLNKKKILSNLTSLINEYIINTKTIQLSEKNKLDIQYIFNIL